MSKVGKIIYGVLFLCLMAVIITYAALNMIGGGAYLVISIIILIAGCGLIFANFKDKNRFNFEFLSIKKWEILAISIVTVVACLLRFVCLSSIPNGMMSDEWSMIYESWSLAHYGIDRNGNSWPVYFVAWGSGQNALLTYLTIPFVLIFGMNAFSARIVMAISSVVTIVASYFLIKKFASKQTAFITMILLTILPWNLMLGRWGLESNLLPCFLVLGVLFLVKSLKENHWWFVLSCFFFGVSLYSYALDYVFLPLFLIACYVCMFIKHKVNWKSFVVGNIVLGALALPLVLFVMVNFNIIKPFKLFNVFSVPKLSSLRPGADGSFNIFANIKSFFRVFIIQSDGLPWNTIQPFGYVYMLFVPFAIVGFANQCKNIKNDYQNNFEKLILTIWLIAGILSSFAMSATSLNHFNCLMVPYFLLIAEGVVTTSQNSRIFYIVLTALCSVMFVMFSSVYFSLDRQKQTYVMYDQDLYVATQFAESVREPNDTIVLCETDNYMITLCANKTSPKVFSETVVWVGTGLRKVQSYKGYTFAKNYLGDENCVYILKRDSDWIEDSTVWNIKDCGDYLVYYK